MAKSYLDQNQKRFLDFFSTEKKLSKGFYFTGGTALSKFYLRHRRSVDLDFFSETEFSPQDITPFIKKAKPSLSFDQFDFQQLFNRNIYQLLFKKGIFLKLEFAYFPFPQIKKPKNHRGIKVDSLLDIAVNKVFTISQKPRGRDFFDLYYILKKEKWELEDLIQKAKNKFDWHIDPIQLGSKMMLVKTMKDDPLLTKKGDIKNIEDFILDKAREIGRTAFK
ncbi:MAG: nucleotidyl transferase AbiEii/AbiGii toxin family protein [Candidatus Shapirobacteria bacterium]